MLISDWSSDVCSSDLGVARGNEPHFARHMIAGRDDDPAPRLGFGHPDAIALIGLAIEFDILDRIGAQLVPPRLVGAPLRVGEPRSEARRVGHDCDSTIRYRGSPYH